MPPPAGSPLDLRGEAETALRLARTDPARAVALSTPGPEWQAAVADPETEAIRELALGTAKYALHELVDARGHLEMARDIAGRSGLTEWKAEALTSLAVVLATAGEFDDALAQLDGVPRGAAKGASAARRECQRALILQRMGRPDDALEAYRRGLAAMRRTGDRVGEARVLLNRGLLHAYAGRFEVAEAELRRAVRLYGELDLPLEAAYAEHNIGFVAGRQGDIPTALRAFEHAALAMARLDAPHPSALLDYCETLLRANLIAEAREVGQEAVAELERAGMETDLAEARLLLAQVALAGGVLDEAEDLALLAQFAFLAQGRPPWEVMARYAWLRIRWERGDRSGDTRASAQAVASDLAQAGWWASAAHARIIGARMALERGEVELAQAELRTEARRRRRAPAAIRIQAWHAEALLRWQQGNARGAQSALRAGMHTLSKYRASLGATELRVNAGSHASDLGRLAIHVALRCGDPERVLIWAERSRASTMRLAPVRPPADDELASRLAELRALDQQLDETAIAGGNTASVMRQKANLEDAIRQRSWHAPGFRFQAPEAPRLKELRAALGDRVLIEFVDDDGALHAVTLRDGQTRLFQAGGLADAEREVDSLRLALNRLAGGRGTRGWEAAMTSAVAGAADRLDSLLFGALRATIGDRPMVVVPTGALHLLPWPALPSCLGRAVAVAPSAGIWLRAASAPAGSDHTVLAAGPGIASARHELRELAQIYPAARRLEGSAATARSVASALDGAGMAHIIAHGHFRADNPLFSSLRLADGPLTVYELERLSQAPRRVVLSACNAGLAAVRPGDELLGVSSALFALGTTSLVASVLLVGDRETGQLMVDFHRNLERGLDAPSALADAQVRARDDDPRTVACASSFVSLGA